MKIAIFKRVISFLLKLLSYYIQYNCMITDMN